MYFSRFYGSKKKHIITTQTEHKCVLDSCRALENEGYRVTYLPVKSNGIIDMQQLDQAMTPDTSIVSIMTVNNEIGKHCYAFLIKNVFLIKYDFSLRR